MISAARNNYFILLAIVVAPAVLHLYLPIGQFIYEATAVLILAGFIFVSYRVQTGLRDPQCERAAQADLRYQMSIIMIFVVAGIVSAVHSIVRVQVQSTLAGTLFEVATWVVYGWGVGYLLYRLAQRLRNR